MRPDVLIIGAGIVGCAVAEALLRRGLQVGLIDPHGVAAGATQASAGMLVPYSEGLHDPVLAAMGARSLSMFEPLAERLGGTWRDEPLFVRAGSLEVALTGHDVADLRQRAAALAAEGVACRFLDAPDTRALEPRLTDACAGALHIDAHGFAPAAALTQALWHACGARGAELVTGAVRRIETSPRGGVRLVLPDGVLDAPAAVCAAGSWSGGIDLGGGPPLPVRPVRGQLLELRWTPGSPARILWSARCYIVARPDGTMLAGATVEDVGFDETATVAGVRELLDGLCELVPDAVDARFTRARVGLRPATPDGRPIIGRSARIPGLVYATGHYRNGVLLAPLTGELVAAVLSGETDPLLGVTAPSRWGEY